MYKNKEFEYDLWTTKDGHYYARIKATGDVCEVPKEIFQYLRCQEKESYRNQVLKRVITDNASADESTKRKAAVVFPLPLEPMKENMDDSAWGYDEFDFTDIVSLSMMLTEFEQTLSKKQREVYTCIFKNRETVSDFAVRKEMCERSVWYILERIRKKAEKFFN